MGEHSIANLVEGLSGVEVFRQLLDSLHEHVAILDGNGRIIAVNAGWSRFAEQNSSGQQTHFLGENYLRTCDSATGSMAMEATAVAEGLRSVLSGKLEEFNLEYPCHSPQEKRWFLMCATPLRFAGTTQGAVVVHTPITARKLAEEALRESEARYRALFDLANDSIFIVDAATRRFIMTNRAASRMLGYSQEELQGMGPEDIDANPVAIAEHIASEAGMEDGRVFEVQHRAKEGRLLSVELSVRPIVFSGRPARLAIARDITQRRQMEEALRQSAEKFRTVADFTYDWEYWRAPDGRMIWISPACERITGYPPGAFLIDPGLLGAIVHPDDAGFFSTHLAGVDCGSPEQCDMDLRIVRPTGEVVWINHKCQDIRSPEGQPLGRRACNRDITESRRLKEALTRLASTDPLTGVSNRRQFLERAEEEILRAQRYGFPLTMLMLDVDHFKQINDTYGHGKGDEALQLLARVALDTLRSSDIFGRIGGEEFAAVLVHTDLPGGVHIAERLCQELARQSIHSVNGPIRFTVSIGLAAATGEQSDLRGLLKRADTALYRAKTAGRNQVCVDQS